MRRYKCIVEYDGTSFVGWQRQTNGYSVQEAVEKSLESITQEKIRIHGSGRTGHRSSCKRAGYSF